MATFKDANGKEWVLKLDAPLIREVRKACNELDLADVEGRGIALLADDPCALVDVLWVLCRSQASGLSEADFAKALCGDAIEAATRGLVDAVADFFPSHKRTLLRAMSDKQDEINRLGMERALAKINSPELVQQATAALEKRLDEELRNALTQLSSATSSPDSAA